MKKQAFVHDESVAASGPDEDRYTYKGPPTLEQPVRRALESVIDPEVALNIVDVGLVYGVSIDDDGAVITMTMTSAACPMTGMIVEDIQHGLEPVLPPDSPVRVELVWDPPWTPERLSPRARILMGW